MKYAATLRETRSRAGQEAHAPHYVQYAAIKKGFKADLPTQAEFMAALKKIEGTLRHEAQEFTMEAL